MSHHVPLQLALKKVPFSADTAHQMRRRGTWTWLVPGVDRRLWIDIQSFQHFLRTRAPFWRGKVDLAGLWELSNEFDFESVTQGAARD